jgi:hypothetical protein
MSAPEYITPPFDNISQNVMKYHREGPGVGGVKFPMVHFPFCSTLSGLLGGLMHAWSPDFSGVIVIMLLQSMNK